jgi:hypothetical protein
MLEFLYSDGILSDEKPSGPKSESALGLPLAFDFQLGSAFTRDLSESSGCRVLAVRTLQ